MYPITQDKREVFQGENRQVASLKIQTVDPDEPEIIVDESDIMEGSLTVDRYCTSGNRIEIGSAIAGELRFKLDNRNGQYDNVTFGGAEVFLMIGSKDWADEGSDLFHIPIGYFTIDNNPRRLSTINVTALDRMARFDKLVPPGVISYPITINDLVARICENCEVPQSADILISGLPNGLYTVQTEPLAEGLTYRQLLQWCAEITGTCAYIDWDGQLRLEWYHFPDDMVTNPPPLLEPSNRYSSDVYEEDVTVTGVQLTTEDTDYIAGAEGYMFNIENNMLIQDDFATVVGNLWPAVQISYRPYEAVCQSAPYVYPLDYIYFDDADGNRITTIVTHHTITVNKNSRIKGVGETAQDNELAKANPLTQRQQVIIEAVKKEVREQMNARLQTVNAFNDLIANALGIYMTPIIQSDGSIKYYLHDEQNLEDSQTIYTLTSDGFAWTKSGWNGGSPVWTYGFAENGNAIFNYILATGVTIADPNQDYSSFITPGRFGINYQDEEVISISELVTKITDVEVQRRLTSGHIQMVPNELGCDFVYVD